MGKQRPDKKKLQYKYQTSQQFLQCYVLVLSEQGKTNKKVQTEVVKVAFLQLHTIHQTITSFYNSMLKTRQCVIKYF